MRASKKLLALAQIEADRLNHVVIIGLPLFADKRQAAQLIDTGSLRKSYNVWRKMYDIADVVWPSNHANSQ